ncbi:hypothetical protein KTO58_19230 [Chitinophaga pendula]|uniref:hypothetical protein n=1 Tax=Chitinophaga TaxID=79328 RepID=UPI0012FE531A|nr:MULTISPECIES: hypothetical protein [Chitinophaga]UCJ05809.1 hypothetical protein KTO58_19230 [Chitinophaga pendula]
MELKGRYVTKAAVTFLANKLNYPSEDWMQDWEYLVAEYKDISRYFELYAAEADDNIRFTLMEMMIETSNRGWDADWITEIWPKVKQMLADNFHLHEYTVYHWCYAFSDDIEYMFLISPCMRKLWKELTGYNFISTPSYTSKPTKRSDFPHCKCRIYGKVPQQKDLCSFMEN